MNKTHTQNKPQHYEYVLREKRLKLIQMVTEGIISIGRAAKELGIKLSTAKLIVKKFRTTGRIYVSRKERTERKQTNVEEEECSQQLNAYNTIKYGEQEIENQGNNYQSQQGYSFCYTLPLLYSPTPVFFYYFEGKQ